MYTQLKRMNNAGEKIFAPIFYQVDFFFTQIRDDLR